MEKMPRIYFLPFLRKLLEDLFQQNVRGKRKQEEEMETEAKWVRGAAAHRAQEAATLP